MESSSAWVRIEMDRDEGRVWEVRRLRDPKMRIHYEIHSDGERVSWTVRRVWLPNPTVAGESISSGLLSQAHRFLESVLEMEQND